MRAKSNGTAATHKRATTRDGSTPRSTRSTARGWPPIRRDYFNRPYDWGYADNAGNDQATGEISDGDQRKNYFRISNAVNADGSAANLKYIDFIKVQTGISQNSGALGEVSTEVFAFEDENL